MLWIVVVGSAIALVLWLAGLSSVAEHVPATPGFLVAVAWLAGDVQSGESGFVTLPIDAAFFIVLVASICTTSRRKGVVGIVLLSVLMSGLANVFSIPMSNPMILGRLESVQKLGLEFASFVRASDQNFWKVTFMLNCVAFIAACLLCRTLLRYLSSLVTNPRSSAAKGI